MTRDSPGLRPGWGIPTIPSYACRRRQPFDRQLRGRFPPIVGRAAGRCELTGAGVQGRWGHPDLHQGGPGVPDQGRRREHLHRLRRQLRPAHLRSRARAGDRRPVQGDRPRDELRRPDRNGDAAGDHDRRRPAVGRHDPVRQQRHRGGHERHPPGPRRHRPGEDHQVRRRVPRPRRRVARGSRQRCPLARHPQHARRAEGDRRRHPARPVQRPRCRRRPVRRLPRADRRLRRRAGRRQHGRRPPPPPAISRA